MLQGWLARNGGAWSGQSAVLLALSVRS